MGIRQCTLLSERRLNALLEGTSVGDSAKDARNVLGIIDIAEAEERLVFLAEVHVHPRIERVAMFEQRPAAGEVVGDP